MVGYCCLVDCSKGDRYLLKLYDPKTRLGLKSIDRLDWYLPLTWNLYFKGFFQNLPYPIKTRDGKFRVDFEGWPLIMFNFIDGRTLEHERSSDAELATLARLVARIHKSAFQMRIEMPVVERFEIAFEKELIKSLVALEHISKHDRQGRRTLRALLLPRKGEILNLLNRLKELQSLARVAQKEMVLCHADIVGSILIISTKGDLYIVDWEGAMLAPPEHDLFFFVGDRFDLFLDNYESESDPVRIDSNIFDFYLYRRNLEDLVDLVIRILHENMNEEQDKDDLEGIVDDCIS